MREQLSPGAPARATAFVAAPRARKDSAKPFFKRPPLVISPEHW